MKDTVCRGCYDMEVWSRPAAHLPGVGGMGGGPKVSHQGYFSIVNWVLAKRSMIYFSPSQKFQVFFFSLKKEQQFSMLGIPAPM